MQDVEYVDAVARGNKVSAENIVEDAAQQDILKKFIMAHHDMVFTVFESSRASGAIFTTTERNTAANS